MCIYTALLLNIPSKKTSSKRQIKKGKMDMQRRNTSIFCSHVLLFARMLDNMVIQEGEFTNDYFQKTDWWRDLPEVTRSIVDTTTTTTAIKSNTPDASNIDIEQALLQAEDENDAQAAITARNEMEMDDREFNETRQSNSPSVSSPSGPSLSVPATPAPESSESQAFLYEEDDEEADAVEEQDMQLSVGHVDQYMLRFWEREMYGRYLGFGGLPEPDQDIEMSTIVD